MIQWVLDWNANKWVNWYIKIHLYLLRISFSGLKIISILVIENCWSSLTIVPSQKQIFNSKIKEKLIFLPTFSPPLAPIDEFFWILKMNMRRMSTTELVNLNKKESYQVIIKALRRITPTTIMKLSKILYSLIKEYII